MSAGSIKKVSDIEVKSERIISLLAVAAFQKAYGYKRLIIGLDQYYQGQGNRRVELYFVGMEGNL